MSEETPRRERDLSEIGDALRAAGDDFVRRNPADLRALRSSMAKARRKRRAFFGGTVVAATAAIVLLFIVMTRFEPSTRPSEVSQEPDAESLEIISRVDMSGRPAQITANSEGAYVTLPDRGEVVKIGNDSGTVEWSRSIGGAPDDIVAGEFAVWVTEPAARRIHALSFRRGISTQAPITVTDGTPQRISIGSTSLRISTLEGPAYRIDFDDRVERQLGTDVAWDIAYSGRNLWVLTPAGTVYPVDVATGIASPAIAPVQVFEGEGFDLETGGEITAAHGAIWYGRPGNDSVIRIDESDGSMDEIGLPGDYLDLEGNREGDLWVLTEADGIGRLIEIDDESGEQLTRSLEMKNGPVDIAATGDGVWVVLGGTEEVLHIDDEGP